MATPDKMKSVQATQPHTLQIEPASGKSYCISLAESMSLTTVYVALALSRRAVSQYSSGARPIPKVVGLKEKGSVPNGTDLSQYCYKNNHLSA